MIPANHENFATIGSGYQITRMLALILDTVALALTIYVLAAHLVKFFSAADPKLLKYFTEVFNPTKALEIKINLIKTIVFLFLR